MSSIRGYPFCQSSLESWAIHEINPDVDHPKLEASYDSTSKDYARINALVAESPQDEVLDFGNAVSLNSGSA